MNCCFAPAREPHMDGPRHPLNALSHFLHAHFLWLLLGAYALAGFVPGPGLWLRGLSFGEVAVLDESTRITLPVVLLALLLLNAGLGIPAAQARRLLHSPGALAAGLAANLLVPVAYIFAVTQAMGVWHNPEEVQEILVGLALVASMPIAGSSTAWSQNADGDVALSLGLVLLSTFLSPLTTPAALHAIGLMARGVYAEHLNSLAAAGTGLFLTLCVALPSAAGLLGRRVLGEARADALKPGLKLFNSVALLLLCYMNAAVSLPDTVANPDWDFLAVMLVIVTGLCVTAFASGWVLAKLLKADRARRAALMFGLGMNNNGTGLVLAAGALSAYPRVLLPIIFYNLVQHLVAGAVSVIAERFGGPAEAREDLGPSAAEMRPGDSACAA
jgi:BASS family bile acid:Na+ symporter